MLLSVITIIISIMAILFLRHRIPHNLRYKYNPVIGNISSLIGIIYGVLAGLMALYLINNINYTADAVQREANAVANLYRDSKWLKDPTRTDIQTQIKKYLSRLVDTEWPLMKKGKSVDNGGGVLIDNIANALSHYNVVTNTDLLIMRDMLEEIKSLYDAREQRIHMSYAALNPEIWIVILIGTVLTIGINYFFRVNLYLHVLTISAAALMCSSMIYLLLTLDRPFQGEFIVESDSFRSLLESIKKS